MLPDQQHESEGSTAPSLTWDRLNGHESTAAAATERNTTVWMQQQDQPRTIGKTEPDFGSHKGQEDPIISPPVESQWTEQDLGTHQEARDPSSGATT